MVVKCQQSTQLANTTSTSSESQSLSIEATELLPICQELLPLHTSLYMSGPSFLPHGQGLQPLDTLQRVRILSPLLRNRARCRQNLGQRLKRFYMFQ